MRSSLRRPLAIGAVLAAVAGGSIYAWASHSSDAPGTALTAATGTQIQVEGGAALTPQSCVDGTPCQALTPIDAQWSPDGSRAVFIDQVGGVSTMRYNNPQDTWQIVSPDVSVERRSPTYNGAGGMVLWAERKVAGPGPWYIAAGSSSFGADPVRITPNDGAEYTDPDGGPDNRVAMERSSGGTSEVVIWDGAGSAASDFTDVVEGLDPAISPDGNTIAYVADGQIWKVGTNGASPSQVTTDATPTFSNPTWLPDSATIAFNSGASVRRVLAAGGASTLVSGLTGTPAYRSAQRNATVRLAGANRFRTAVAVSQSFWASASNPTDTRRPAQAVVLSRSDDFADALGGASLAAAKDAPLLLTPPTSLNPDTLTEMQRVLGATTKTVYLLGGTGAISAAVESQIVNQLHYPVVRLSGLDRYATAVAIANAVAPNPTMIIAATGLGFPDALPAGAAAGSFDSPGAGTERAVLVLTNNSIMPAATQTYLDAHASAALFAVGGAAITATAGPRERKAISGANRYATARNVAFTFYGSPSAAGVATGLDWPDALAGGALMGTLKAPLVLTPPTTSAAQAELTLSQESSSLKVVMAFGGTGVVVDSLLTSFGQLISGPGGSAPSTALPPLGMAQPATALRATGAKAASQPPPGINRTAAEAAAAADLLNQRQ